MVSQNSSDDEPTCKQFTDSEEEFSFTTAILEDNTQVERSYAGPPRKCHCGRFAPRFTDWNSYHTPGRRYFGCPDWVDEQNGKRNHFCNYKEWCDPPFCCRSTRLIKTLKRLWGLERREKEAAVKEIAEVRFQAQVELGIEEEMVEEIAGLKLDLSDKETNLRKLRTRLEGERKILFFLVIFVVVQIAIVAGYAKLRN